MCTHNFLEPLWTEGRRLNTRWERCYIRTRHISIYTTQDRWSGCSPDHLCKWFEWSRRNLLFTLLFSAAHLGFSCQGDILNQSVRRVTLTGLMLLTGVTGPTKLERRPPALSDQLLDHLLDSKPCILSGISAITRSNSPPWLCPTLTQQFTVIHLENKLHRHRLRNGTKSCCLCCF